MAKCVLVCGLGRFGLKVVELLCTGGADVIVITDTQTRNDRLDVAKRAGAIIIQGDMRDATVRAKVNLYALDAAILTAADDALNLEVALELRASVPNVRVVMRSSNERLSNRLEREFEFAALEGLAQVLFQRLSVARGLIPSAHVEARQAQPLHRLARMLGPGPYACVVVFVSPEADLEAIARNAGLEWVNSDADKIRAAQEAIANEPKPVHVPRERKPVVVQDDGPLILVETRKDLKDLALPFEDATSV